MQLFDRIYQRGVLVGLITIVWFSTLAHAAHDLWAGAVLFGAVTLLVAVFCLGRVRDNKPLYLPLLIPSCLFLAALWGSSLHSYNLDITLFDNWGWTFAFLVFYLFINVADEKESDSFLTWTGGILLPLALICIWQQFTFPTPIGYEKWTLSLGKLLPGRSWTITYGGWEIPATLNNSIVLAGFALYWPLYLWEKSCKDRRFVWLLRACLLILVMARSVWAFVCLFLGFSYFYSTQIRAWAYRHKRSAFIAGGVSLLILLLFIAFKTYYRQLHPGPYYLASSRLYYWLTALRMWHHHPWTGVGTGAFATAYSHFRSGPVMGTLFAHCFPLQMLAETGCIGEAALFLWGGAFLYVLRRNQVLTPSPHRPSIFNVTLLIVLCFSLISINLEYLLNKILLLLFVGSSVITYRLNTVRCRRLWIAGLGVGVFLLAPFWFSLFAASRLYTSGLLYESQRDQTAAYKMYRDAIDLDPYQADSYWRLAQIHRHRYEAHHLLTDKTDADTYLAQAIRYKKDPRFLLESLKYAK